jgi:hypothetical protein
MDTYRRFIVRQKVEAAVAAEKKHGENIVYQELKLIEAQRLLTRSKRLLEDAIARRISYQKLLDES